MPKNLDLITKTVYLSAAAHASQFKPIGTAVAAGMKRFVTFVRVSQRKATGVVSGGSKVYFVSTTGSAVASQTGLASAGAKLQIWIHSAAASQIVSKHIQVPEIPDTKNPLFSIAAGKWLTTYLGGLATQSSPVQVFVQYYDE